VEPGRTREDGVVRTAVADDLEAFIERGGLWSAEDVEATLLRIEAEAEREDDPLLALLAKPLSAELWRLRLGPVPRRLAADIEAVAYPRLWKVAEAVRQDLPDGELRVRIEVMNRRLSRRFAEEQMQR
jgi:hypothetical protein